MEVEGIAELPAEANPLTEGLLFHTLKGTLTSDTQQLITSKQQLEQWEHKRGFYFLLLTIYSNKRNPDDVRLQSIVQIKNGIERHWRRGTRSVISDAEKAKIREGLLKAAIAEHDSKMAVLAAVVISRIARADFPAKWPTAVGELVEAIRVFGGQDGQPKPIELRRSLLILLNVVKEVSTARVGPGRPKLRTYSGDLLNLLSNVYSSSFRPDVIQAGLQSSDDLPLLEIMLEQSLLSIKIIRRLAVGIMEKVRDNETVKQIWEDSLQNFQAILHIAITHETGKGSENRAVTLLHRNLGQVAKMHVRMAKVCPTDFAILQGDQFGVIRLHWQLMALLGQQYAASAGYPAISQVIHTVHDFDETRKGLLHKLGHQALLLLRACVTMVANPGRGLVYRTDEEKSVDTVAMEQVRKAIFTDAAVVELVDHIVMELLLFQPTDLREWEEEPDEWEKREEASSDDYEFAARPCAEKLLVDLSIRMGHVAIGQIMKLLATVSEPGFSSILQKEAVYCAVGLTAPSICDTLDFKAFLTERLVPEVQIQQPEYKIIRRRIAILVGEWAPIEASKDCLPICFQICQFLLNKDDPLNDQVVRVAAGRQLNNAVLAYGAAPGDLKPYMSDIIQQLIFVIEEVELTETKNMLLHTMSNIVERMEELITPYAEAIITLLPRLWDQSGDQHLMKQTVLVVLCRLFRAMGEAGATYHTLTLPLIHDIVKPDSKLGYVLMEETLDLWCTVIQETPSQPQQDLNADLLGLMEYLPPLLEQDTENTEKCIDIMESYTVLAPGATLSREVFPKILASFNTKLGNMNPCHSAYVTNAVEAAWCAGVALVGSQAIEEILFQLLSSGFLDGLINGLKESWEAHQTTGPKAKHTSIQGLIETDYFAMLSRIAFESPEHFIQALGKCAAASALPKKMANLNNLSGVDATMEWLLDEWLTHVEDLSDPERRKLMNLAITQLLRLPQPYLLNRMQRLFSLWTSSIIELTEGLDDRSADCFVLAPPEPPPGVEKAVGSYTPHERRKQELRQYDPVVKVNLIALVKTRLGEYVQRMGGEGRFRDEVLVNMDGQVVDDFLALGIM